MPGFFLLSPGPVFLDPNQQTVQENATLTVSGSTILLGYGVKEINLVVNVKATPTGTLPTLQYTLQEVDPGDGVTVFGSSVSTVSITAVGVYAVTLRATQGGALKVSWVVGGTTPSFTQVYATLTSKATSAATGIDGSGVERPVLVDGTGRLEITGAISATNPSVGTNAAAIPTSSTQVGGSDGTNLQAARVFDADTSGGTQYVLGTVLRKSASGGSVEAGTATDPLRVDPTGTTAQPVTDNGGSLTVDTPQLPVALVGGRLDVVIGAALPAGTNNIGDVDILTVPAPLSTTGGGTEATALRVTVANDSTGVLSVDDNGGSLTVDTPQLPAALVGGRLDVVVGAQLPAGTNNIGDVDILTVPAPLSTTGGGTEAAALRVTVANDSTGVLSVDDNGGSLTVDGTVTANQGTAAVTAGAWPTKVTDGSNTAAVKGASTAAVAADPALVVAISPNNVVVTAGGKTNNAAAPGTNNLGVLPALANAANPTWVEGNQVVASVNLSGALRVVQNAAGLLANWWAVRVTDGTNAMPTADVAARSFFGRVTDGTNTAAVKAASTAAVAADPALVVAISPNTPITTTLTRPATSALTSVASSATNVTILASNVNRLGATVFNDSNKTLYLKLGATASTTSHTVQLGASDYYEIPFGYTGIIDGLWSAANGSARITELTA